VFAGFNLVNPNHDGRMTVFRLVDQRKWQKCPKYTNTDKLWLEPRSRRIHAEAAGKIRENESGSVHNGLNLLVSMVHGVLCSP